jgi:hypothetical protein
MFLGLIENLRAIAQGYGFARLRRFPFAGEFTL